MNEHQRIAIEHHCRFAFETAQPRFCYSVAVDDRRLVSVIITVNSGYE